MAYICCLAGIERTMVPTLSAILRAVEVSAPATVARLDVAELGRLAPDLLVCDVDDVEVDPLELLRRIRFVLPACTIAVYTNVMQRRWAVACHLAGVNCVLSKESDVRLVFEGIQSALRSGCYTDPRFTAPVLASDRRI